MLANRPPNSPTSDEELVVFADIISSLTLRRGELAQKMTQLRSDLVDCEAEDAQLEIEITTARRAMNPIHRIPQETWREIFAASCLSDSIADPGKWQCRHEDSLSSSRPPWTLARVSTRWREIVQDYPVLWSSIRLNIPTNPTTDRHRLAKLLTQLFHSGTEALNVSIVTSGSPSTLAMNPLLTPLLTTSSRWNSLSICAKNTSWIPIFSPIQGRFSSLRTVKITDHGVYPPLPGLLTSTSFFAVAPKLHTVQMNVHGDLHLSLPVSQIRHLEDYGASMPILFDRLPSFINLETCIFGVPAERTQSIISLFDVTHPRVTRLTLLGGGLIKLLERPMKFPSLSSLTVKEPVDPLLLVPLVQESGELRFLSLVISSSCAENLVDLFEKTALVENVVINSHPEDLTIIRPLKVKGKKKVQRRLSVADLLDGLKDHLLTPPKPLLPLLKSLTFIGGIRFSEEARLELSINRPLLAITNL